VQYYNVACSNVVPGSTPTALHTTPVAIGIEHVNDYTLIRFDSNHCRRFDL